MNNNKEIHKERKQPKTVILILTHSCNLNCVYCYEHHKGNNSIDLEEAKEIIENEMNSDDDLDREFEFLGGEPLLEFEKIVELHNFLCSREWPKKWTSIITTNGTLVHGKIKEWLLCHQNTIRVSLSADGTPDMQNINRSSSYGLIDYDFFVETHSVIKMTISDKTLKNLAEGVIYLHNLGFRVITANLAFGIDWSSDDNLSIFATELRKLADFYIENPRLRPADIMNMQIDSINPQSCKYVSRHCGAGGDGLVAYETDGTAYPCHTFAPVSVGDEIAKKSLKLTFEYEVSIDKLDEKCRNCLVSNVCPNCYGINFSTTGNMYSKDEAFCRMTKVQFIANAYFRYRQYLSGVLDLKPEEEYRLLNNIALVQNLEI
jgi:radical SAM protein with 4Fe4S-binding SPASM domain